MSEHDGEDAEADEDELHGNVQATHHRGNVGEHKRPIHRDQEQDQRREIARQRPDSPKQQANLVQAST